MNLEKILIRLAFWRHKRVRGPLGPFVKEYNSWRISVKAPLFQFNIDRKKFENFQLTAPIWIFQERTP